MYAKHSIRYDNLESYFYGFSIWNEKNECLDWDETLEYFNLLGIVPVRTLYRGIFDKETIHKSWTSVLNPEISEGYVVRTSGSFHMKDFKYLVAKYY